MHQSLGLYLSSLLSYRNDGVQDSLSLAQLSPGFSFLCVVIFSNVLCYFYGHERAARLSGGRLATTLVATINNVIFFSHSF